MVVGWGQVVRTVRERCRFCCHVHGSIGQACRYNVMASSARRAAVGVAL